MEWKKEWDRRDDESEARWLSRITSDPAYINYVRQKEIQDHFAAGESIVAADDDGVYERWPDGRKVYIKKWADEQKPS